MRVARRVCVALALLPGLALAGCGGTPTRSLAGTESADMRCPGNMIQLCTGDTDSRIISSVYEKHRFCICQAAF